MCLDVVKVPSTSDHIGTLATHERLVGVANAIDGLNGGDTIKGNVWDSQMGATQPICLLKSLMGAEESLWHSIGWIFGNVICLHSGLYNTLRFALRVDAIAKLMYWRFTGPPA